ncbi:MAG: CDP-alcohol phosphatidyltransferase family protein [Gemmatimonadetes bacterium]|nr:CDP-alcohol phosphatidyltransferase family protein [Gemmatimonadota bacterium]
MTRLAGVPGPGAPKLPADDHHGAGFLTLGNFFSLLRIPLGFMFLVVSEPKWVAAIVIAGAATDLLDGLIARVTHTESEIGALLDPFCDRIFVFLALVSFLPGGRIDWAEFLILILRDIFTGGVFWVGRLAGKEMPFHSRMGGKVTTALQVAALLTLIFYPDYVKIPVYLAGVAAVYAIIDYGTAGIRKMPPAVPKPAESA